MYHYKLQLTTAKSCLGEIFRIREEISFRFARALGPFRKNRLFTTNSLQGQHTTTTSATTIRAWAGTFSLIQSASMAGSIPMHTWMEIRSRLLTQRDWHPSPKHVPQNPNKKPPPEHRTPGGDRERNIGHPDGEEHSRQPKGQRGTRGSRGARGFGPIFIYDLTCAVMAAQGQSSPLCPPPEPPPDSCPTSI